MPKSKKTSHLKLPDNPLGNRKKRIKTHLKLYIIYFFRQYITPQFIFGKICSSK
jgi:hypothetical protein